MPGAELPGHLQPVAGVALPAVRDGGELLGGEDLEQVGAAGEAAGGQDHPAAAGEQRLAVGGGGDDAGDPAVLAHQPAGPVLQAGLPARGGEVAVQAGQDLLDHRVVAAAGGHPRADLHLAEDHAVVLQPPVGLLLVGQVGLQQRRVVEVLAQLEHVPQEQLGGVLDALGGLLGRCRRRRTSRRSSPRTRPACRSSPAGRPAGRPRRRTSPPSARRCRTRRRPGRRCAQAGTWCSSLSVRFGKWMGAAARPGPLGRARPGRGGPSRAGGPGVQQVSQPPLTSRLVPVM